MRHHSAFLVVASLIVATGCNSNSNNGKTAESGGHTKRLDKLVVADAKVGTGDPVKAGDEVWVLYTGKLGDGTVFDASVKHGNAPFHVKVGTGGVIKGWDQGILGMKVGGERNLSIPASLAYGNNPPQGSVPPDSDLFFNIHLLTLLKAEDADSIVISDVKIGTGPEVKEGNTVTITYEATAAGKVFDTSIKPQTFKIGDNKTQIPGLDEALKGMKVGGERKVSVPPDLTRLFRNEKLGMNVAVFDVHLTNVQ